MSRIFLGGTTALTKWRDQLIPLIKGYVDYFNPVVDNWTEECIEIENNEKYNKCDIHLYVITPDIKGVYSIAEAVQSAYLTKDEGSQVSKVIFAILESNLWTKEQMKSLEATMKLISEVANDYAKCIKVKGMQDLANKLIITKFI